MILIRIAAVLTVLALVGCDSGSDRADYRTVLVDPEGGEVSTFTVSADLPAPGGTATGDVRGLGTTTTLRLARADDGTLTLSLSDGTSDSGTELVGQVSDDGRRIVGEWFEVTIAGPQRAGTFRAERQ